MDSYLYQSERHWLIVSKKGAEILCNESFESHVNPKWFNFVCGFLFCIPQDTVWQVNAQRMNL